MIREYQEEFFSLVVMKIQENREFEKRSTTVRQTPSIVGEVRNTCLQWAGHMWWKKVMLIRVSQILYQRDYGKDETIG